MRRRRKRRSRRRKIRRRRRRGCEEKGREGDAKVVEGGEGAWGG